MDITKSIEELAKVAVFIEKLNETNSLKDKEKVLEEYKNDEVIRGALYATYNTYIQYNVTSKNVEKFRKGKIGADIKYYVDYQTLLDDLNLRKITGHIALLAINHFCWSMEEYGDEKYREVFYKILDKDLSIRIGITTINKIFNDLIPTYDVALGYAEKDVTGKHIPNYDSGEWDWSRKLDGLRCTIRKENGVVLGFSRSGKQFKTIQKLLDAIEELPIDNVVFDGELCIIDENGDEDFVAITKEYNKGGSNTTHQIEDPKLMWFDLLTLEEFDSKISIRTLRDRREVMKDLLLSTDTDALIFVEQTQITSKEHLEKLKADIAENPKIEGGIARKNAPYKGKRSHDVIKIKVMTEEEYVVTGVGVGPFKVIEKQENGTTKEVIIETMTQLFIDYKGNEVAVGSGYSLDQRKEFYADNSLVIGKEITVSYFETSIDSKTGKESLRFPVFKKLWENGTRKDTE